jgi:uncharacterized protein DUF4389
MTDQTVPGFKPHWKERETWSRGLFMLLFALVFWVAEFLLAMTAVFQFGFVLFTGRANERLLTFSDDLSRLFYQLVRYLTFNTDERPFPFADWPGAAPRD